MTRAGATIRTGNDFDAESWALSVTVTVMEKLPVTDGDPVMTPAVVMLKPGGKDAALH